jgi:hypothetical protein
MLVVGGTGQLFSPCFLSIDGHEEISRRASRERGVERHGRAILDAVLLAPRPWSLDQTVLGEVLERFPANRDST